MHTTCPPVQNYHQSALCCRSTAGSWLLEQKPAGPAMLGMREGGTTGAAYYVLSREGADFVAVPVSQWLSFRLQRQCVLQPRLHHTTALPLQAWRSCYGC